MIRFNDLNREIFDASPPGGTWKWINLNKSRFLWKNEITSSFKLSGCRDHGKVIETAPIIEFKKRPPLDGVGCRVGGARCVFLGGGGGNVAVGLFMRLVFFFLFFFFFILQGKFATWVVGGCRKTEFFF